MNMDARTAFAEAIAQEMDMDLSPEFMAACDKALIQLWLRGYAVLPAPDEEPVDERAI